MLVLLTPNNITSDSHLKINKTSTLVGKTTLDEFMTTPGEMGAIEERTLHPRRLIGKGHVLPKATRKRVVWSGEKRVLHTSDIGGQQRFWNLWVDDLVDSVKPKTDWDKAVDELYKEKDNPYDTTE